MKEIIKEISACFNSSNSKIDKLVPNCLDFHSYLLHARRCAVNEQSLSLKVTSNYAKM